jgi:ATP-dependent DNA ligase
MTLKENTNMPGLPTLYKKSSTGALQYWTIGTEGNVIVTAWGQVGGAEQVTRDEIKTGKNLGKKNATTASEQAELEALAKWEKQLKKGYVKTEAEALAGKVDEIIEGGVAPMLAHKFSEQGHKIKFPALAQPKFDGHRCIAVIEDGKASLWTRTRKPITGLPHIVAALKKNFGAQDLVLDGELYCHDYRNNFEDLSSFIRTPDPKPGHEVVEFHIYDLAVDGMIQSYRTHELGQLFRAENRIGPLVRVETIQVADEDELMAAFDRFLEQGYEGCMVRNMAGLYVNKRSHDLLKIKEFDDTEFKVVGVESGRGKMADKAIFVCETADGTRFQAKMKGKLDDLKKFIDNPNLAIGRLLTVQYQGITNKSQVPRFPVALRLRDMS